MKLNTKGQELRHRHGLVEGDEVDVVEDGNTLRIVHRSEGESRGERVVSRMRNTAATALSTDELMELLRGD